MLIYWIVILLVAVQVEAEKIRLGQRFDTFRDFDRCMDSYGVIHGRAAAKYATKHGHAVRVCHFGMTNRPAPRTCANHFKMNDPNHPEPPCPVSAEAVLSPFPLQQRFPTSTIQSTTRHFEQASELEWCQDSQPQWSQDSECTPVIQPTPLGKEIRTVMQHSQPQPRRQPFTNLPTNIPSLRSAMEKPISTVRHTRFWLPPHNPAKSGGFRFVAPIILLACCSTCCRGTVCVA